MIINTQMHGDEKGKHAFNEIGQSDFGIRRQDSFISKMSIFGKGFFEPPEQKDIPVIP